MNQQMKIIASAECKSVIFRRLRSKFEYCFPILRYEFEILLHKDIDNVYVLKWSQCGVTTCERSVYFNFHVNYTMPLLSSATKDSAGNVKINFNQIKSNITLLHQIHFYLSSLLKHKMVVNVVMLKEGKWYPTGRKITIYMSLLPLSVSLDHGKKMQFVAQ